MHPCNNRPTAHHVPADASAVREIQEKEVFGDKLMHLVEVAKIAPVDRGPQTDAGPRLRCDDCCLLNCSYFHCLSSLGHIAQKLLQQMRISIHNEKVT